MRRLNLKSPAGFARRLDDMTCGGCHQTRAIGGFHLPGAERRDGPQGRWWLRAARRISSAIWSAAAIFSMRSAKAVRRTFHAPFPQGRRRAARGAYGNDLREWLGRDMCCGGWRNSAPDGSFASWTCAEG
jgi:hypothetical protein